MERESENPAALEGVGAAISEGPSLADPSKHESRSAL